MANFSFAKNENAQGLPLFFNLSMANRHGLIAGATGTGKTVTLQTIAEKFSEAGVSVFTADVKGDLSGLAIPAQETGKIAEIVKNLKIEHYTPHANPVVFWDIYGQAGHPLRTTIAAMGSLLMGRLLNLNDVQQGVLNAAFSVADDEHMTLIDLKDLTSLIDWMGENAANLKSKYGNITSSSLGTIQRGLLTLKQAGGDVFFGEPDFKINDLLQKDSSGKGIIHILDATKLIADARLYSTFLLWLLTAIFENLPEIGDQDKPKLAFFFDEAHLMFNAAPKPLLEKIEQLVRLIRSKGVGVYFITQSPLDVPETVLGQLGNRVQHALRAYTPKDQKAVKVAADTFRKNPELDTSKIIQELSVGEALVSLLDEKGAPTIVERVKIYPPCSKIGAITEEEKNNLMKASPFYGMYEKELNRESAFEILAQKKQDSPQAEEPKAKGRPKDSVATSIMKSTARSFGTQIGRQIVKGILGSIFGKK